MSNVIAKSLTEDVLRNVFRFLDAPECFSFMATCTQLWCLVDFLRPECNVDRCVHDISDSNSGDLSCCTNKCITTPFNGFNISSVDVNIFNKEWGRAGALAIERWNRLIGPMYSIRLVSRLTSSVSHPDDLIFIFRCVRCSLRVLDVHVHDRRRKQSGSSSNCASQSNSTFSNESCSNQSCLPSWRALDYELCLQLIHFTLCAEGLRQWRCPERSMERFNCWLGYGLKNLNTSCLRSLELSIHLSLLKCRDTFFDEQPLLQSLSRLTRFNISVGIQSSRLPSVPREQNDESSYDESPHERIVGSQLDWGLCHVLKGPRAISLHYKLFKSLLSPVLSSSQLLRDLTIECVVPEALDAVRQILEENVEAVQRLSLLRIKVQRVFTLPATSREKALAHCTNKQLEELINLVHNLGFSVPTDYPQEPYDIIFVVK